MNTSNTTLTIKTPKKLRTEAKKVADTLGIPLTTAVNAMLRQFVRDRRLVLDDCLDPEHIPHIPNATTRAAIREGRRMIKEGKGKVYRGSTKDIFDSILKGGK